MAILDVGSGRRPTIPLEERPPGCHYVGLDLSASELARAPDGSYDEVWVADVVDHLAALEGQFDLVISWQVLEHVKPLDAAFGNFHSYLRPGGRFIGQFSGTFAFFALGSRVIPHSVAKWAMKTLLDRDPETVFPATYHHCWDGALRRILKPWSSYEIVPRYSGAPYLRFSRIVQRGYLIFEDWAYRGRHRNLATHYLVEAQR